MDQKPLFPQPPELKKNFEVTKSLIENSPVLETEIADDDRPPVSESAQRIFILMEQPEGQEERIRLRDWKNRFPIAGLLQRAGTSLFQPAVLGIF